MLAALLFATLSQGGLAMNAVVPKQMVDVLQAVVILAVATSVPEVRRLLRGAQAERRAMILARLPRADAAHRDSVPVRGGGRRDRASGRASSASRSRATCSAARSAPRSGATTPGAPWIGVLAAIAGGVRLRAASTPCARSASAPTRSWSASRSTCWRSALTRFFLRLVFDSSSNSPRVAGLRRQGSGTGFGALVAESARAGSDSSCSAVAWVLYRTPFGLRVRAVGEHPEAAASVGVRVARVRYIAVALSGVLAGLGGAYLALDQHQFTDGMTAGRGFIALAAIIFGRWDPVRAGARLPVSSRRPRRCRSSCRDRSVIPSQFVEMIPYVLTIIALAGVVGRAVAARRAGEDDDE